MKMFYENPAFIKKLDAWLDVSDQKDAASLDLMKGQFPVMFRTYSKPLYRGMVIKEDPKKGFTISGYTSWSKDKNIAIKFLNDPKYKFGTRTGTKVLLTKKFTTNDIILDIHALAWFLGENKLIELGIDDLAADSALKEQEVLITKNIKISPKEIEII